MITFSELRDLLDARPFKAFRLLLSDGSHIDLPNPQNAITGKEFAIVGIFDNGPTDEGADGWKVVWYSSVIKHETMRWPCLGC
jgi:hypothetical protein